MRAALLTAALSITLAAVAVAQTAPAITPEFTVTPPRSGTKAKPRNALVYTKGTLANDAHATLRRLEYTIPPTITIDGTGFPTCSADFVNANGDDGCPKRSKVGKGTATALLGPNSDQLDFDVEIYAAGPKALTIYLQTSLFNIALPGTISGRVVGFDIPERVQQPVPGLYAYVTSVAAALGKQNGVRGSIRLPSGRQRFFAATTGCRDGRYSGKVEAFLAANPDPPPVESVGVSASSRCTRP